MILKSIKLVLLGKSSEIDPFSPSPTFCAQSLKSTVVKLAISHPQIAIRFINNNQRNFFSLEADNIFIYIEISNSINNSLY